MSLAIANREREGILIVDLHGRIVMGPEASSFRAAVEPLFATSGANVILEMRNVDYIDSTGLGAMVLCSSLANRTKGAIKLLNMNIRNLELLVTTKLETIFENFNEEQDAINSFFPDRAIKKFDILAFVREQRAKAE